MNEGGYHSIPTLSFPGGMLAGCSAGFMNVMKIKGAHNAMKSGIIAAETIFSWVKDTDIESIKGKSLTEFDENIKNSWITSELKKSRNFKNGFKYGLYAGLLQGGLLTLTQGKEPYTLKAHKHSDSNSYIEANLAKKIDYPKPDGVLTFDLLTNLTWSGTMHDDN